MSISRMDNARRFYLAAGGASSGLGRFSRAIQNRPCATLAQVERNAEAGAEADSVTGTPEQHGQQRMLAIQGRLDLTAREIPGGVQRKKHDDHFQSLPARLEGR